MPAVPFHRVGLLRLRGRTFSEEDFELLMEALRESGYVNVNGALNVLADYTDYKAYLEIEEFEHNVDGEKIYMEVIKEIVNGHVSYYIKDVEVE